MSWSPLKYYDHELFIKDTTQSSSPSTGALVVSGGMGVSGNIYIGGTLRTTGTFYNVSTAPSTSVTTGAFVINGGLGLANTTDAVSITNGGSMTIAGGAAIAKTLFVGGSTLIRNELIVATGTGTSAGASIVLGYGNSPGTTGASTAGIWVMGVNADNQFSIENMNGSAVSTQAIVINETS